MSRLVKDFIETHVEQTPAATVNNQRASEGRKRR